LRRADVARRLRYQRVSNPLWFHHGEFSSEKGGPRIPGPPSSDCLA
jgi:hypothetical protein